MTGDYVGQAVAAGTGRVVVERLYVAKTWWSRFCGLQFRRELPQGYGLLLSPCSSIHMFWMRFPIDLIFLSGDGVVVEVRRDVRPWTVAVAKEPKAHAALEVPVGSALVDVGEALEILRGDDRRSAIIE